MLVTLLFKKNYWQSGCVVYFVVDSSNGVGTFQKHIWTLDQDGFMNSIGHSIFYPGAKLLSKILPFPRNDNPYIERRIAFTT